MGGVFFLASFWQETARALARRTLLGRRLLLPVFPSLLVEPTALGIHLSELEVTRVPQKQTHIFSSNLRLHINSEGWYFTTHYFLAEAVLTFSITAKVMLVCVCMCVTAIDSVNKWIWSRYSKSCPPHQQQIRRIFSPTLQRHGTEEWSSQDIV